MTAKNDLIGSIIISIAIIFGVQIFQSNKIIITGPVLLDQISIIAEKGKFVFGIPQKIYSINTGTIKKNQFLSGILTEFDVPYTKIEKLVKLSKDVFDVRKIRTGKPFSAFFTKDSIKSLHYLVYEPSPAEYVIFDLKDSIQISKHEKQVVVKEKTAQAVIESSLWESMVNNKINPEVSGLMSDVYAWTIDFFGLQVGDYFSVIYEEKYVDSVSIGLGNIKAALFNHNGRDFYAIPFMQDSILAFYDDEGNSLKKAFLKAPLKFNRISSGFTHSRFHPVYKFYRPHTGVDYAAPTGTPVYALGDGTIVLKGFYGDAGNTIRIKHNGVYTTGYNHLSKFAEGVNIGSFVKQGDLIGYVGSTGASTGPHLDFRVWKNNGPIDPLKLDAPSTEPIKKESLEQFEKIRKEYMEKLRILPPQLAMK